MSELDRKSLGQIADCRMGETILSKDLDGYGYPIFSADTSSGAWGRKKNISKVLKRGSIVVGARGTIGNPRLPDHDEFGCTQTTIVITPSSDVNPYYLKLALENNDFKRIASQQAVPMLSIGEISKVELPLPPLSQQKKIAEIISAIEKQIKLIKNKYFKFVLLKESFINSEINNFQNQPNLDKFHLEKLSFRITDGEHQTPLRSANGYYLLSARNIRDGYLDFKDVDYIPQSEYERISKRIKPQFNDLLISCSGSVGRSSLVPKDLSFCMVRSVALVRPNQEKLLPEYLLALFSSKYIDKQIRNASSQLAQSNLFQAAIKKLIIPLPDKGKQNEIAKGFKNFNNIINSLDRQIRYFNNLKNAISQDLLSGRKRVNV